MEEKVIKTIDCGLGITLDIYNNRTFEYTIPPIDGKENIVQTEIMEIMNDGNSRSKIEIYKVCTAVVNKHLKAAGLPEVNEQI